MNIAIDIRNIGGERTGSEAVVVAITKQLLTRDRQSAYLLLTDTHSKERMEYIVDTLDLGTYPNAQIVSLWAPHRAVWLLWSVARFCRTKGVEIFYTEYIVPLMIGSTTKVVTHIHDVSFATQAAHEYIGWKDLLFLRALIPRSIRRADVVIAVSDFTRSEIRRYYPFVGNKLQTVYNATSLSRSTDKGEIAEMREKYELPEKFLFSLGTMQPRKNIPFLIEAFADLPDDVSDVHLVLSGPRAENFDDVIDQSIGDLPDVRERIHFTGYIDPEDLSSVYQQSRALVVPSVYEGFSIPALEALSLGVPAVLSDIPAHREVARDVALYFDPHQIDQCTSALYTICSDEKLREILAVRGKSRAESYSWDISGDKILDLMRRLMLND